MRDLMNRLHVLPAFVPAAAVVDNTAQVSAVVDLKGFSSCMLAFVTGNDADADATFSVLIEDSDDNVAFGAVSAVYLDGTAALAGYTFADDGETRKIGYVGTKRYVRATITPANNTGNVFLGGMWVLGQPSRQPTANPPM